MEFAFLQRIESGFPPLLPKLYDHLFLSSSFCSSNKCPNGPFSKLQTKSLKCKMIVNILFPLSTPPYPPSPSTFLPELEHKLLLEDYNREHCNQRCFISIRVKFDIFILTSSAPLVESFPPLQSKLLLLLHYTQCGLSFSSSNIPCSSLHRPSRDRFLWQATTSSSSSPIVSPPPSTDV